MDQMILGMPVATYTLIHTLISLAGIVSGFVVLYGLLTGRRLPGVTAFFLTTTVATSVTGFGFPIVHFGPPHVIGILSLVILAVAIAARYTFHLAGSWRAIYVYTAVVALYLNVFVGVVQAFQKIPVLHAFAPHGSEPAFAVAQLVVLALFVVLALKASSGFRNAPLAA
jgi:hypothetical protein